MLGRLIADELVVMQSVERFGQEGRQIGVLVRHIHARALPPRLPKFG